MQRPRESGFTLIELAIVLVILGLLVGGVLVGQTLIHNAELRAVVTESRGFQVALSAFRDKYFALPGDMKNAVRFWGAQEGALTDGLDSDCTDTTDPATGTATCNGDGDGQIGTTFFQENYRAWQHLANAGLVEGRYIGINGPSGGGGKYAEAGVNVPRSRLNNGAWSLYYYGPQSNSTWYDANYGNALVLGGGDDGSGLTNTPILTSVDAAHIDTKADDGYPNTGRVFSWKHDTEPDCAAATDDSYTSEERVRGCHLIFISGY